MRRPGSVGTRFRSGSTRTTEFRAQIAFQIHAVAMDSMRRCRGPPGAPFPPVAQHRSDNVGMATPSESAWIRLQFFGSQPDVDCLAVHRAHDHHPTLRPRRELAAGGVESPAANHSRPVPRPVGQMSSRPALRPRCHESRPVEKTGSRTILRSSGLVSIQIFIERLFVRTVVRIRLYIGPPADSRASTH